MAERATLIKIGKYEHLAQLQEEGILYMNNLPFFWGIKDNELRGDQLDGMSRIDRGVKGEVTSPNGMKYEIRGWNMRIPPPDAGNTNLFCMCALGPAAGSYPMDERNLEFGDYALVFYNPQQFMDRVYAKLKEQRIVGRYGLVEYVENDFTGEIGPFVKLKKYFYQSEWRLAC